MKKKIFDRNLFIDAFRQMRVPSLACGLVLGLQALLLPIGDVLSSAGSPGVTTVVFWNLNPWSVLMFSCFAPLMALYLFRFLSQRNACDFYHAIPQTRTCLYVSFTAALFAWDLILLWGSTLIGVAAHAVFPKTFSLDMRSIFIWTWLITSGVIFVLGAVMLAVTLTGSFITNLAVSLLIIFFPRILMGVVKATVENSLTIMSGNFFSFFGQGWNVVTTLVFSVVESGRFAVYENWLSGIYTALVGLVYLVLAGIFFRKRRSEAAGEASVSQRMQTLFRLIPAGMASLLPCMKIFDILIGNTQGTISEWYQIFVLYILTLFLYFLYELVSTRRLRNLAKAVPALGFLAAFNLLVIFGMFGMRTHLLSFSPDASQIESVRLTNTENRTWGYSGYNSSNSDRGYFSTRVSDIELTDEGVKQIVAGRLKESIEFDKTPAADREQYMDYLIKEVAIKSGGKTHYRSIHLSLEDQQQLASVLRDTQEIRDIYMNLPDAEKNEVTLKILVGEDLKVDKTDLIPVYEALKEDIREMGFEKWYMHCVSESDSQYSLVMNVRENGVETSTEFYLSPATPRAWQTCREMIWEKQADSRQEMLGVLEKILELSSQNPPKIKLTYCGGSIDYVAEEREEGYQIDLARTGQLEALIQLVKETKDQPIREGEGCLEIYLNLEYVMLDGVNPDAEQFSLDDYQSHYYNLIVVCPENFDFSAFQFHPYTGIG